MALSWFTRSVKLNTVLTHSNPLHPGNQLSQHKTVKSHSLRSAQHGTELVHMLCKIIHSVNTQQSTTPRKSTVTAQNCKIPLSVRPAVRVYSGINLHWEKVLHSESYRILPNGVKEKYNKYKDPSHLHNRTPRMKTAVPQSK